MVFLPWILIGKLPPLTVPPKRSPVSKKRRLSVDIVGRFLRPVSVKRDVL
jgi:hypothetical protein